VGRVQRTCLFTSKAWVRLVEVRFPDDSGQQTLVKILQVPERLRTAGNLKLLL